MFAQQPNKQRQAQGLITGTRLLPILLVALWLAVFTTTALAKPRPDEQADDRLAPGSSVGQLKLNPYDGAMKSDNQRYEPVSTRGSQTRFKRTARGFAGLSEEARLEMYRQLQGQGHGSDPSHHGNGRNRTGRSLGKGRKRPSFITQVASGGGKGGKGGKDYELDEEDRDLGFGYFETCPIFDCFCFGLCPKQKDKDLVKKCETGCSPGIVDYCRKPAGGCSPGPGVTTTVKPKPKPATCDTVKCTCKVLCDFVGPNAGIPTGGCGICNNQASDCLTSGKCTG